ncbi:MAG: hypothetical protein CVU43_22990 [Chloroflexi bacterium HGW-Chloroflexi-5]|jgi:hypothetical protein|nr:MAG: hypothetical protein CVU43_22990 [Chloroflexi bacterium HGW-Chloroflexi-5]
MISDEYRKLYHYTTWDGSIGILKTQSLWATHYKFLNDYTELALFRNRLVQYIAPAVREQFVTLVKHRKDVKREIERQGGIEHVVQHDAMSIVNAAYSATGEDIYIASFCGEDKNEYVNRNGLLSQWRGYGSGGGVALVFDTKKLEEILKLEAERYSYDLGLFADVIYSDDEAKLKRELSDGLKEISAYVSRMLLDMSLNRIEPPDATNVFPAFIKAISRYKHQGFKEENEVRIVCLPTNVDEEYLRIAKERNASTKPEKEPKARLKRGKLVPYIDLFDSTDNVLPIERAIIGPHIDKELRASFLRAMFRKSKFEVTVSDIPYVE